MIFNVSKKLQTFELSVLPGYNFGEPGIDSYFEFDEDAVVFRVCFKGDGYTSAWEVGLNGPGFLSPLRILTGTNETDIVYNEKFYLPQGERIYFSTAGASNSMQALVTARQVE